jgi:hypothetical protein
MCSITDIIIVAVTTAGTARAARYTGPAGATRRHRAAIVAMALVLAIGSRAAA